MCKIKRTVYRILFKHTRLGEGYRSLCFNKNFFIPNIQFVNQAGCSFIAIIR